MDACACFYIINKFRNFGNFLAIQCLGLCAFSAKGMGSTCGQGTKILQTQKREREREREKKKLSEKLR